MKPPRPTVGRTASAPRAAPSPPSRAKLRRTLFRRAVWAPALLATATCCCAQTEIITFDELTTTNDLQIFNGSNYYYTDVPTNYDGLIWNNFGVTAGLIDTNSGYQAAVISSRNVVFNRNGNPASISSPTPFNAVSAYLTAAWDDNLQVEVQGFAGGALTYDRTYTLSAVAPTLFNFNFTGVDEISFRAFGGTPHSGYSYSEPPYAGGTWFAMDNFTVVTNAGTRLALTLSGTKLILTWPTNATGLTPQSTTNLASSTAWTPVSTGPTVVNGQNTVTDSFSGVQRFYRLAH